MGWIETTTFIENGILSMPIRSPRGVLGTDPAAAVYCAESKLTAYHLKQSINDTKQIPTYHLQVIEGSL